MNSLLLVDDEEKVCEMAGRFFKAKGFAVSTAYNGEEALKKCAEINPEVVLMDVRMPRMDGIEALKMIKSSWPDTEVIMATAMGDAETAIACMKAGAFGYQIKPLDLQNVYFEIGRALDHRKLVLENRDYQANLERKVEERTNEIRSLNEKLKESFLNSIRILTGLVELYDPFLGGHSKRVAFWSGELGKTFNLSKKESFDLEIAGLLHDIGTVGIPENLKNTKFSELTANDVELIKQHPVYAQNMLSPSAEFDNAGLIVRHHLEHLDGSGFPDGLKDEAIPFGSRILAVTNAFDELTSRRRFTSETFQTAKSKEDFVFDHLKSLSGRFFQQSILDALEKTVERVRRDARNEVLIPLEKLKAGMTLASDIYRTDGYLVIARGYTLNEIQLKKILAMHQMDLLKQDVFVYKKP